MGEVVGEIGDALGYGLRGPVGAAVGEVRGRDVFCKRGRECEVGNWVLLGKLFWWGGGSLALAGETKEDQHKRPHEAPLRTFGDEVVGFGADGRVGGVLVMGGLSGGPFGFIGMLVSEP